MQLFKRLTACVLALVLCLGMLPTQTNAQENSDMDVSMGDDIHFRGTNGFGNLLGAEFQQAQESEEASGDCGISDLTFDGQTATVEYFTNVDAVLTVAVYTEDHLTMVASATVEVTPDNDVAEVTFQDTLPEYFTASAFLMDGYDFSPLCEAYSTSMYTENMQKLLASTVDDYDPELVLNLDGDDTTNFAVYMEDTKRIPYQEGVNRVVKNDEDNHIYVIENADSSFTSLKEGDIFSYAYGVGEYLIGKVGTITIDGTTVTITGAEVDIGEVFSHVKVEYDGSDGNVTVDTSNASPYVEFLGMEEPPQTFAWEGGGTNIRMFPYKLVDPVENDGKNIKLSGNLTLTLKAEFSFYFSWSEKHAKVELSATLDLSVALEAKIELFEIPLGYWYYGIPGLYIDFSPKLVLSLWGKVSVGGAVSFTFGVEYDHIFGTQKINHKPVWDISKVEAQTIFFFGIDFSPEAVIIEDDVASLELGVTTGLEVKASLKESASLQPKETPAERHACKACIDIQPKIVFTIKGKCNVLNWDRLSIMLTLGTWGRDFQPMYYSIDNKVLGVGKCPNREFLVTFETYENVDGSKKPISATVTGQYGNIWDTTDDNGTAQVYMRAGTHYLTAGVLDKSAKTRITVPYDTKATFELSRNVPGGSTGGAGSRPGYTSGGTIGGALGKVDTEKFLPDGVVAAGECGLEAYWELDKDGKLRIYGNGEVMDYSDMEDYYDEIVEVEFEHGITEVYNYPLERWPNVTSMTVAGSVNVAPWCFRNSESLKTVRLIRGIREIGEYAFYGCERLHTVILPDTLKTIELGAFFGCRALKNVDIPGSVTSIGYEAFASCEALERISIPRGVKEIEYYTFLGCSSLKEVTMPSTVTTIGKGAFASCGSLTQIVIPDSVTTLEEYAFQGCKKLEKVTLSRNLTKISERAFADCTSLTSVVLPDTCTGIEECAFYRCSNLRSVTLGSNVTAIGDDAFSECDNLEEIVFGEKLTSIGANAFWFDQNLKRIVFKGKAPTIGSQAFYNVEASVYYPANNASWTASKIASYDSAYGILTWIPYTLDSSGNMVADEAAAVTCAADGTPEMRMIPQSGELQMSSPEIPAAQDTPVLFSIHGGQYGKEEVGTIQINVASFTGLVPGADYILLAIVDTEVENPLVPDNLLYIDQAAAENDGTLKFRYIPRIQEGKSYVFACGPKGQDLKDAVVTFPVMYKSETPLAVNPTVTYNGIVLAEGIDYEISGEAGYTAAGNYTCIIRGIYDYSGEVSCTYTVSDEKHIHSGGTATCTKRAVCTVCGSAYGEVDLTNHIGDTETRNASNYGCNIDGYTGDVYCLTCGQIKTKGQVIPKAHRYENGTCYLCGAKEDKCANGHTEYIIKATPATCTNDGWTEGKVCAYCGIILVEQQPVKSTGHKEVTDPAVAATCTTDGKTEGSHCSVCNKVLTTQYVVKARGHKFIFGICSNCGAEDPNYVKPTEPEVTEPKPTEPEVKGVTRVFGADRYATAFKAADTLKEELGVQKFQNVIVASGTGFADALAGSYLAAQKQAPILLVRGANVNDVKNYIKSNLASGGTVYLLGGVNAVPKAMETGLEGFNVKRLGGADRYSTNLLILQEAGVGNKDIIVCTGKNFADSLSASATGLPILLVKDGLNASQKEFLASTSGKKIIVGGVNAVNTTIEKQLATYGSVKRLAGNTRYDTSVLVAKEFFDAPTSAVLAYAQNFPDGLSGGPLAYVLNAPLILTDSKKPTAAVTYATGAGIKSGYVLGGTGLISDKVVKNIFSMASGEEITVK